MNITIKRRYNLPSFFEWLLMFKHDHDEVYVSQENVNYEIRYWMCITLDEKEEEFRFIVTQSQSEVIIETLHEDPQQFESFWKGIIQEFCAWVTLISVELPDDCEFVLSFTPTGPSQD